MSIYKNIKKTLTTAANNPESVAYPFFKARFFMISNPTGNIMRNEEIMNKSSDPRNKRNLENVGSIIFILYWNIEISL